MVAIIKKKLEQNVVAVNKAKEGEVNALNIYENINQTASINECKETNTKEQV